MAKKKNATISISAGIKRPDFKSINPERKTYERDLHDALYYVHYEVATKKLKDETIKYTNKNITKDHNLDLLENYYFSVIGKGCYLKNHGSVLNDNWENYLSNELPSLIEYSKERKYEKDLEKEATDNKPVISIQDRIKEHASNTCAEIEGWADEFMRDPKKFKVENYDIHTHLITNDIKGPQARFIVSFYEPVLDEIKLAVNKKDNDVVEAYSLYSKAQLKKLQSFYEKVIEAANVIIESSKVQRKTRKKKPISKDKKVAKLKFLAKDVTLGLVSISATDVLGAKELWVYNTKTRKIGKYIALDDAGLDVKGSNIINFNETDSIQKTLRKPAEQIKEFKSCTKPQLKKYLDGIKAIDIKLKAKINEHVILLKAIH